MARWPRWARDGGNGAVASLEGMEQSESPVVTFVPAVFTIDVLTVDGWRRLNLTRDQARSLTKELAESILRSEA